MKQSRRVGLAGGCFVAVLSAAAAVRDDPYQIIAWRNAFGLRPAVVQPAKASEEAPVTPPVDIKITGVTTLLGTSKASFQYEDPQTKRTEYTPLLGEGDSCETFRVVSIDPESGRVRINRAGQEIVLDFVHNGVRPTAPAGNAPPKVVSTSIPPMGPPRSNSFVLVTSNPANDSAPGGFTPAPSPRKTTLSPEEARRQIEKMWAEKMKSGAPVPVPPLAPPGNDNPIAPR